MLVEEQKRKTQFFAQKTNELFFNEIESIRQKKIKRLSLEESTHTHTHTIFYPDHFGESVAKPSTRSNTNTKNFLNKVCCHKLNIINSLTVSNGNEKK